MIKRRNFFEAFDALPETEKQVFTVELLRRVTPFDSGPLEDSETAEAADQLMAALDTKENHPGAR
ncbi:MAG TPA: hypothetical protein VN841_12545 [Bryobacteraceae bacterium]|nr:hypothetical protein [Bryobacteraceae bacterium]